MFSPRYLTSLSKPFAVFPRVRLLLVMFDGQNPDGRLLGASDSFAGRLHNLLVRLTTNSTVADFTVSPTNFCQELLIHRRSAELRIYAVPQHLGQAHTLARRQPQKRRGKLFEVFSWHIGSKLSLLNDGVKQGADIRLP